MDELTPHSTKKSKQSAPIARLTAEERAKQFSDDFYADGGILFCRFCEHSVDFVRVDTLKDHLKSKKHAARKEIKKQKQSNSPSTGASSSKHIILDTLVKSEDMRKDFILDYLKMCTMADIPLEKKERIRPFFCTSTANKQELYPK